MRFSILSSVWTAYVASNFPCHPNYLTWSKDQIVPGDPHSAVPMPTRLINARGNQPFTDKWEEGQTLYACSRCPHPGFCKGSALKTSEGINPPDILKGPIARSVLRAIGTNPRQARDIDKMILDLDVAIKWDSKYPMTKAEKEWVDTL